jgi:hypothetical protein
MPLLIDGAENPARSYDAVMAPMPDRDADQIANEDFWREKVEDAQRQFDIHRTPAMKTEWRRVLKIFTDLVLRDRQPVP